ncbi:hypothetical protein EUX98_g7280 [Antrodiella citrinella]|uniref:Uncharacterized protein n=1 Tax=Antrodiella citrinella TaxID=2447956 RepID=A0A4S4MMH4_9APHY|nr:hypothetical protein EUX98_g7280 [Antrodiella citrinella]
MAPIRTNRPSSNYTRSTSLASSAHSLRFGQYSSYSSTQFSIPHTNVDLTAMRATVSGFLAAPGSSVIDVLAKLQLYPTLSTLLIVLRHMEAAHHVAHGALREPNYTINGINELLNRFRTMMVELEFVQSVIINTMVMADVNPEYLSGENLPPPLSPSPPPHVPHRVPDTAVLPGQGTPPEWWGNVPTAFIPRAWEVNTVDPAANPPHTNSPVFVEDPTPALSPAPTPVTSPSQTMCPLSPLGFLSTLTDVDTGYLADDEHDITPHDAEAAQILRAFSQDGFMFRDELAQFIDSGDFWHQGDFVVLEANSESQ